MYTLALIQSRRTVTRPSSTTNHGWRLLDRWGFKIWNANPLLCLDESADDIPVFPRTEVVFSTADDENYVDAFSMAIYKVPLTIRERCSTTTSSNRISFWTYTCNNLIASLLVKIFSPSTAL